MRRIVRPFTVEIKGGRRTGPSAWLTPPQDPPPPVSTRLAEAPAAAEPWRLARILPALEPEPVRPVLAIERKAAPAPAMPEPPFEDPNIQLAMAADVPAPAELSMSSDRFAVRLAIVRQVKRQANPPDGPSRGSFRRGERWRHRLPAVIQQSRRPKQET